MRKKDKKKVLIFILSNFINFGVHKDYSENILQMEINVQVVSYNQNQKLPGGKFVLTK